MRSIQKLKVSSNKWDLEFEAQFCKNEFFYFVKTMWDVIIAEDPVWNWHIKYLCDELQQIAERVKRREPNPYDLIINIPPGTTKSTICSVMYPAWCWTIDPTQRLLTGSHTESLSLALAVRSRDIIQSDKYAKMFPGIWMKEDQNNKGNYENNHTGSRYATSIGGSPMGFHAHQIIIDDPIDPKKVKSEKELENTNIWMGQALSTRKVDKKMTPTILIMQRLSEKDPTADMLSKTKDGAKVVKHICLPGELSDNVKPPELKKFYINGLLDPIRLDRPILAGMKTDLGSYGYAGQVDQTPAPAEGGIFKRAWFRYYRMEELMKEASLKGHKIVWNFTVDGAFTKNEKNAQSAILAYCFFNNQIYIRNSLGVWEEFHVFIKTLEDFVFRNGYSSESKIYVEPKATGLPIIQTMKSSTMLNLVIDTSPKDDKVVRARAKAPFVESGRVHLLNGEEWGKPLVDQCATFPNSALKDRVDTMVMAIDRVTTNHGGGFDYAIL